MVEITILIYLELFNPIQISRSGSGRIDVFGHIGIDQIGSTFFRREGGEAVIGSDRIGSDRIESDRIGSNRIGSDRIGSDRIDSFQIGSKHLFTRFRSDWIENCALKGFLIDLFSKFRPTK